MIQARLGSSRLPRKPLLSIAGEPLVVRVVRRVAEQGLCDRLVVATDAEEIAARYEARRADFVQRLGQIIDAFRAEWVGDTEAVREYVMGHLVAVQQAADLANQNN